MSHHTVDKISVRYNGLLLLKASKFSRSATDKDSTVKMNNKP